MRAQFWFTAVLYPFLWLVRECEGMNCRDSNNHTGCSTCMAVWFSPRSSWLRPSPACRGRHPWLDTSCAACRRSCLQIWCPSSPDWVHTFPAARSGVRERVKGSRVKLLNLFKNKKKKMWGGVEKGYSYNVLLSWIPRWHSWRIGPWLGFPLAQVLRNSASGFPSSLCPMIKERETWLDIIGSFTERVVNETKKLLWAITNKFLSRQVIWNCLTTQSFNMQQIKLG